MLLLSRADLRFWKEERTLLREHYIFSFQNVDLKCMVSVLSSVLREIGLASSPVLGSVILPSSAPKRFLQSPRPQHGPSFSPSSSAEVFPTRLLAFTSRLAAGTWLHPHPQSPYSLALWLQQKKEEGITHPRTRDLSVYLQVQLWH